MEYVDGETLAQQMPHPSLSRRIQVLTRVAEGVGHAHAQGIYHRDLKPANILIARAGRVLGSDFGLARRERDVTRLASNDAVLGTTHYMAPEQMHGKIERLRNRFVSR